MFLALPVRGHKIASIEDQRHPSKSPRGVHKKIHSPDIDLRKRNSMKHSFNLKKAHHSARLAILASREKDRKEKVGEKKVAEIVRAKL